MEKIIFIFEADVNKWDSNAIHLARAANIVRKDIFEHRNNRSRASEPLSVRHSTIHDVPIPIYITMKLMP